MSKIYAGADFTVNLDAGVDLSTATTLEIRYIKPDSSTGSKDASYSGTTASADITPTENTSSDYGGWRFYVYAVIDSKILIGETFKQKVTEIGL